MLHIACGSKNEEILRILLEDSRVGPDLVNVINWRGKALLHFAVSRKYFSMVRLILDSNKADVNILQAESERHSDSGRSAWHLAVQVGKSGNRKLSSVSSHSESEPKM